MTDFIDFIFRLSVFCAIHSLLASNRIKMMIQAAFGKPLHWYRLAYNIISVLCFGWVMLAWQSTGVILIVPGIWGLVLHGIQFLLLCIGFACLMQTGLASFLGTDLKPEDEHHSFVITGCHSIVRHPLYSLGIIFLLINPVITTRSAIFTLIGSIYMIAGAVIEERRMFRRFGDEYRRYQEKVPFMIPRINR